jgi:hypothetical protein
VNGGVGGPILRDKLWFFTSHRSWGSGTFVAGLFANKTPTALTYTPDPDQPALNDYSGQHHTLRTTWQPAVKHRINLSYDFQRRYDLHRDITPLISPEATDRRSYNPVIVSQATWTYPATNKLLFEGGFSFVSLHANVRRQDGVPADLPSIREMANNFTYRAKGGTPSGAGFVYQENYRHKYQSRLSMTYVVGSHSFKTGVDWLAERSWDYNTVNADTHYNFNKGAPASIDVFQTPLEFLQNLNADLGVFGQDQWRINRLTLNLGLRLDYLNQGSPAQHEDPARYRPQPIDFDAVPCGPCFTDLSPRLGASYDLFGNGKTAVKVGLNRYVLGRAGVLNNPATNLVTVANRVWADANKDFVPQESELQGLSNTNFGKPVINTRFDDSLLHGFGNRQYNWQTMVAVQHQLLPNVGVNVGYYRTMWYNFSVTDNLLVAPTDYDQYCLTLPSNPRVPGAGTPLCGLYDVKPTLFGKVDNLVVPAERLGKLSDVYDGVDATVSARLPNGSFVGGGLSTGRERINNCLTIDSPQAQLFCDVAPPFQTQFKAYGSYPLPLDFNVSGNFQALPGIPISADYVVTRAEVLSSLKRNLNQSTVTIPNIIAPQTQFEGRLNQLDLRLTKTFKSGRSRIQGMFDVYNVLNASTILSINTRYGNDWLKPLQILDARLFKLGVQVNF